MPQQQRSPVEGGQVGFRSTRAPMRRILWAVSAMGVGHAHRSLTISRRLARDLPDVEIIFASGSSAYDALKSEGAKCLEAVSPVRMPVRDGYLDVMAFVRDWVAREADNASTFFHLVNHYQPCLVVSDELPSLTSVARDMNVPSVLITDFLFVEATRPFFHNKTFNALLWMLGPILTPVVRHSYERIEKVILATDIANLPAGWQRWARQHVCEVGPIARAVNGRLDVRDGLGLSARKRLLVVAAGGSSAGIHLAGTSIDAFPLIRAAVPEASMLVVLGPSTTPADLPADTATRNVPGLIVREYLPDLVDYLAAADLVVCGSGQSILNEIALRARVPAITCPVANHWEQIANARRAASNGFARVIARPDLRPFTLAREAVEILSQRDLWERMAGATFTVRENDGARRAAEAIASLVPRKTAVPV